MPDSASSAWVVMMSKHRALVVEDDPEAAADLVQILTTCGADSTVVTNRDDALRELSSNSYCIVLLDLEIRTERGSILGRIENGQAVLESARRRFPQRVGDIPALPIIVISGHAAETDSAVAAMRDGASDVVQKLSSPIEKTKRIHIALERAGRTTHERCAELVRLFPPAERLEGLVLAIPADRDGQRAVVTLSGRRAALTMASLRILLPLVEARFSTGWVSKIDLGGRSDAGFKSVSNLRDELKPAFSGDIKQLIVNDHRGSYALAESVSIGDIDVERLKMFGDVKITACANKIAKLLAGKAEFPGKS